MRKNLLLILLLFPAFIFSQTKTIYGIITAYNEPVKGITVSVKGTNKSTESDVNGFYKIKAKQGEILDFEFYRFDKVSIIIEDVTETLNVKMYDVSNYPEPLELKKERFKNETIGINHKDFSAIKIEVTKLTKNTSSITDAILEKIDLFKCKTNSYEEKILYVKGRELNGPVSWEIDNRTFDLPIPLKFDEIKNILIINYMGSCVIKIDSNINYRKRKDINFNNYYFNEDDFYAEDAIRFKKIKLVPPNYLKVYKKLSSKNAIVHYKSKYDSLKNQKNFHLNAYNYFNKRYRRPTILLEVLANFESFSKKNPEDLKTIAYKYQELKENFKAIKVYKKILTLRPNYAQSYRDLANAFITIKDYKNAWKTYNFYLKKGFKIENNDIGSILYSEMVSAYNSDKEINTVNGKLKLTDTLKNTNKDIRMVFEWNSSEAEFEIEFVNPDYEVYRIENSLLHNDALITDQKLKGYSSKEIFIDKLLPGNYLVNLTYFGNKKETPTTLKVTTYYYWGKKKQRSRVQTFDFSKKDVKIELLQIRN